MASSQFESLFLAAVCDALPNLSEKEISAAIELFEAGNTIPFIARYRKEATGGLDETQLRAIEDALEKAQALQARKTAILKSLSQQGILNADLRGQVEACQTLADLEAVYLPFKPTRRTRAQTARDRGLGPLADLFIAQKPLGGSRREVIAKFVDSSKDVPDEETAIAGALDIVAQHWADDPDAWKWLVDQTATYGRVVSSVKRGKKDEAEKFEQYIDRDESVRRIPSHRLHAVLRGQHEGVLKVKINLDKERTLRDLRRRWLHNRNFELAGELEHCVEDCFDRLLMPAAQSTVMKELKTRADEEAIEVFGKNLRELLMSPPGGPRVTIGIDPGFRTGCKVAVVDSTGKFLENATIYPTPPKSDVASATKTLLRLVEKHSVELIAIGNGTASRETDQFVGQCLKQNSLDVTKVFVSESGASIYSASELAAKEFPNLDITVRGAISIARRLQDPLAELVKTDPKSIGVGQYQHDVDQTRLRKCLDRIVQSCVNHVGVDLNTASASLLSHVSGIGPKLAELIVDYRDHQGRFSSRKELTKVPKLGKKAFEQAAGFLRIRDGKQPLDNSAVHPERYEVVDGMAKQLGVPTTSLVGNASLSSKIDREAFVAGDVGLPTINDILEELARPGRDPRSEFKAANFDDSVNEIGDVKSGMVLEGVVTNVTHFGAFVDIGVHQDGLIHISQLSDTFVEDPSDFISVGDICRVKVMEVDIDRKRIALTRKF